MDHVERTLTDPEPLHVVLAKRLIPYLEGVLEESQIQKMLLIVMEQDPQLALQIASSIPWGGNGKSNPKKRKDEDRAVEEDEDVLEPPPAKKKGMFPAHDSAAKARESLKAFGDKYPRMCGIIRRMLEKYESSPGKHKYCAQQAYFACRAVREAVADNKNPDTAIALRDVWLAFDVTEAEQPAMPTVATDDGDDQREEFNSVHTPMPSLLRKEFPTTTEVSKTWIDKRRDEIRAGMTSQSPRMSSFVPPRSIATPPREENRKTTFTPPPTQDELALDENVLKKVRRATAATTRAVSSDDEEKNVPPSNTLPKGAIATMEVATSGSSRVRRARV